MINPGQLNEGLYFFLPPPGCALIWSGKQSGLYVTNDIRYVPSVRGQDLHLPKSKTEAIIYSLLFPSGSCRWCRCKQAGFYSGPRDHCIPLRAWWAWEYHQEAGSRGGKAEPGWHPSCASKPTALSWVTWDGHPFVPYYTGDVCLHWSIRCKASWKLPRNMTLTVCSLLFLDGTKSRTPTDVS